MVNTYKGSIIYNVMYVNLNKYQNRIWELKHKYEGKDCAYDLFDLHFLANEFKHNVRNGYYGEASLNIFGMGKVCEALHESHTKDSISRKEWLEICEDSLVSFIRNYMTRS